MDEALDAALQAQFGGEEEDDDFSDGTESEEEEEEDEEDGEDGEGEEQEDDGEDGGVGVGVGGGGGGDTVVKEKSRPGEKLKSLGERRGRDRGEEDIATFLGLGVGGAAKRTKLLHPSVSSSSSSSSAADADLNVNTSTHTTPQNFSRIDTVNMTEEQLRADFPLFIAARKRKVAIDFTLEAGEMLFLPAGWYHEVQSLGGIGVGGGSSSEGKEVSSEVAEEGRRSSGGKEMHGEGQGGHLAFNYWFHPPDSSSYDKPYTTDFWLDDFRSRPK